MAKLLAFNGITLDGYFTGVDGDMSWAHRDSDDPEWRAFVDGNARGGGRLLFGRVTYEMMAGYWPTPMAAQNDPVVAERMNSLPKVVFSRTLKKTAWNNTRIVSGDLVAEVRRMKREPGDMAIMGSGSIIAQLTAARLIDEYQVVINPIVLGKGRTMFDGIGEPLALRLVSSRVFRNGKVVLNYAPRA
jgi:dihydrofolate reductase